MINSIEFININGDVIYSLSKFKSYYEIIDNFKKNYNNLYYKICYYNILIASIFKNKILYYNSINLEETNIILNVINININAIHNKFIDIDFINNKYDKIINNFKNFIHINDINLILHLLYYLSPYYHNIIIKNLNNEIKNELFTNENIYKIALKINGNLLQYLSPNICSNKEIIKIAMKSGHGLEFVPPEFKDDKEIILLAIKKCGKNLQFASSRLKNDKDVILMALNTCGNSYIYASTELQNDEEIIFKAIKKNHKMYLHIPINYKNNIDILLEVLPKHPNYIKLTTNISKDLIMEIIPKNIIILKHISRNYKNDKDIFRKAYIIDKNSFKYASKKLRNDINFINELSMIIN